MGYGAMDTSPKVAETMAFLLVLYTLQDWRGSLMWVTDSGSATMRRFTALPREETYLGHAFRALAGTLKGKELQEVWQPAQHSTGWSDLLALLNAKAHERA